MLLYSLPELQGVEFVELEDKPLSTYAAEQQSEWCALCLFFALPLMDNLELA